MKTLKHILACGGMVIWASSCTSSFTGPVPSGASYSTSSASSVPSSRERGIAERIFSLVNSERARVGKRALRGHYGLNKLAQKQSNSMGASSRTANHFGSENRAEYADLKYNIENLSEMAHTVPAGTDDPAASAVAAWKNSASYHRDMLQSWDLTGIGVRVAPGGRTFVTMCLGVQFTDVPRSVQPGGR